ncbi:RNA-directed DNA polymerase, eukaryota, reverse transcriptase zinc-binding domain protein [Tanacetum coccineum]|uniref:RNA-directed DNA polymerase, eukaryota, reverse transcriptase zinc-binding domain protein n=1 Tax=Tanacetum coccineum TaxID=301880 RepID=A0ABQ5AAY6_9ASTR
MRVNAWAPVQSGQKFIIGLMADWKAKTMSFEGRLTLVKSILGSLPLYYFLMFHVPGKKVWLSLEYRMVWRFRKEDGKLHGLGWVDHQRLCNRFPRLYHLDRSKEGSVLDKGSWEKMIHTDSRGQETIWNKLVPKKVNIFVWMDLKGRLLVRVELDRIDIDLDSILCPCCDIVVEMCGHSLVTCDLAMSVWEKVFNWWKVGSVNAFSIDEVFASSGGVNVPTLLSRV